ncbi:MAG: von Willebrand factor type A domain-containing protein [Anaerolineae bacterium]|nr:von Willebrand factor type A domain-containing protein [Anaerolineae bacterium]
MMKTYSCVVLSMLSLAVLVLSSCGGAPTPQMASESPRTEEPVRVDRRVATQEVEKVVEVQMEMPAPSATAVPSVAQPDAGAGPSTGGSTEPNDQPYGDMFFEDYGVNPRIDTEDDHFSTFAVDVDTASYTVMRRYISDGFLPPDESVRVEEFINFFDQEYTPPEEGAFAIHLEGASSPYAENYHLVRVGLQGYEIFEEDRDDVVLTFVIDVSGSMDRENRLGLVKQSLELLVNELRPTDEVGIVVYGSRARVILEPTEVSDQRRVLRAIRGLDAGGSTYAEEGLVMAYQLASRYYKDGAINRVILCSDGVANVGNTGPESILEQIRSYADEGIYLTTVGVGMGNYNDVLMEQLADNGDGFYAYVDTLKEAERVFVHDLPSTLQVIARDAKVQVDFNPTVVRTYRLIGYENRDVADEDFRNDAVDAGEIGVGHSVTALYEVKFQKDAPARQPALTVYVRYEDPEEGEVVEISKAIAMADFASTFEEASPRFQLTAIVAHYAEILRHSYWAKEADLTLEDIQWDAARITEYLPRDEEVQEFADLVARAVGLSETR